MKVVCLVIVTCLMSLPSFTRGQEVKELYGHKWSIADHGEILAVERDGVVTMSVPDSSVGFKMAGASIRLPLYFVGDSVEIQYKIRHIRSEYKDYSPFRLVINNYESASVVKIDETSMWENGWSVQRVKLPILEDSKYLYLFFTSPLKGIVQVSLPDVRVFIDDVEYDQLTELKYKFLTDHEFDNGSGIRLDRCASKDVEKLTLTGQVWSLLRYYHPVLGGLDRNSAYELFRILPRVLQAPDQVETEQVLLDWIRSFGEFPVIAGKNMDSTFIEDMHVKNEELRRTLYATMQAKRSIFTYGDEDHSGISAYSKDLPDAGYRILSLFQYWGKINYFSPYKYAIGKDWNTILFKYLPVFIRADTREAYLLAALRLFAEIQDSHASTDITLDRYFWGKNAATAVTRFIEDKAVVAHLLDDDTTGALRVGDVISRVNGKRVSQLYREMYPFIAASNEAVKRRNFAYKLLCTNDTALRVVYERDGKRGKAIVPCPAGNDRIRSSLSTLEKENNLLLADSILYLYPLSCDPARLTRVLEENRECLKGIIIDMRCYPLDISPVTRFISDRERDFATGIEPVPGSPGRFQKMETASTGDTNSRPFQGKTIVLVNEYTQSMAEFFTMELQACPNVITIGSQTAGADGNISSITLPGGITARFSGIGVYYPDGGETQRIGVRVNETILPTLAGFRAGRDEILERAIELLKR